MGVGVAVGRGVAVGMGVLVGVAVGVGVAACPAEPWRSGVGVGLGGNRTRFEIVVALRTSKTKIVPATAIHTKRTICLDM